MKKSILRLITISSTLYGGMIHAGEMGTAGQSTKNWTGLYLGANAGGWWSSSGAVNTVGTPSYISTLGQPGAPAADANVLASIGTNNFSISPAGFIGGGQIGYNYQIPNRFVIGLDVDMDGVTQSKTSATVTRNYIPVVGFTDYYNSAVLVSKNIDYLGTVRGRLGMLIKPTLLIYGTGGLAYGAASLNTVFTGTDQVSPVPYPTFFISNHLSQTLVGWTAGGGGEWLFHQNWSAKVEYLYYNLGTINNNVVLTQLQAIAPIGSFASANVHSSTLFTQNAVRVGLNYHFS